MRGFTYVLKYAIILLSICFMFLSCAEDITNPLSEADVRGMLKGDSGITIGNGNGNSNGNGVTPMPGSGKIAFLSLDDNGSWLYLINPDGTEQKLLSGDWLGLVLYPPFWSPDGRVAYLSFLGSLIQVMDTDGTTQSQILINTGGLIVNAEDSTFSWSSRGQIAFSLVSVDFSSSDIYVMNADGTNMIQATISVQGYSSHPSWSPDGTQIAFAFADINGNSNIYMVDAAGLNAFQITFTGYEHEPAWSPNGNKIAFTSDRNYDDEIYMMNIDGTSQINLTNKPSDDDHSPTWSSDGAQIAFIAEDMDGNSDVYVMGSNGTNQVNITNTPAIDESMPSWSP